VDHSLTDRRTDVRYEPAGGDLTRATLRPGCAVSVVDLSAGGALVQAGQPLRPGARVHLQLVTTRQAFGLVAVVLRCAVWTLHGEHGAIYRGALKFDERCHAFREPQTPHGSPVPAESCPATTAAGHLLPGFSGAFAPSQFEIVK
jgi:hypothetical protein